MRGGEVDGREQQGDSDAGEDGDGDCRGEEAHENGEEDGVKVGREEAPEETDGAVAASDMA